jgi:hypothetical protein
VPEVAEEGGQLSGAHGCGRSLRRDRRKLL